MKRLNIPKSKPAVANKAHQQIAQMMQLGVSEWQKGKLKDAQAIFNKVLALQPDYFDALQLSAIIAGQSQNFELALKILDQIIKLKPDFADAHSNRGLALKGLKKFNESVTSFNRAIALKSDHFQALFNRGIVLKNLKRLEEALASYERAITIKPDYAEAYNNRGNTLKELKRLDDALASYDRAIAIKSDYADAHSNRGLVLTELNRLEEALTSYDRAIAIKPDYAEAYNNRGNALKDLKRFDDALTSYDRAITIKPDYADAHFNKSVALLLGADFKRGWEWYEWRWKMENSDLKPRQFTQRLWLGAEDIANKTILLHEEQGLGDTIQFCRYAKLVQQRGAKVLLEAPKALIGLLETLEGVDTLLEKGKPLPAFDYHCPLLSLPLAFKTELDTIPSSSAYLSVAHSKREEWTTRLGDKHKPRIGLVWSGSTGHKNDHNRSLSLNELLLSLPDGFEYFSLQKEVRATDKDVLAASGIKHYGEQLNDFTDTAALCELMDVVISVDTSVAHLAGAIGKPTWILLPYIPDWRWLLDRADSPWYPSVKLYRQEKIGGWKGALEKIKTDLTTLQSSINTSP